VSVDKPVVLRIAETMASVASSQQAAEQVAKFKKQAEDAKTQARSFQVRYPHNPRFHGWLKSKRRVWGQAGGLRRRGTRVCGWYMYKWMRVSVGYAR
jgi:hypothetical protein